MYHAEIMDVCMFGVRIRLRMDQPDPPSGARLTFGACNLAHWGELLQGQHGTVRWRRGAEAGVLLTAPLCARGRGRGRARPGHARKA